MSFASSQHITQLLGLSIFQMERTLAILMIIIFFFFFYSFFSANFQIQMPEKVYDILLWNFIYDIGHPKSVRSEPWLTEAFSLMELPPLTMKTLCALLLLNHKRYRSKTFCKLLRVWYRSFVTFQSKGSDHFL